MSYSCQKHPGEFGFPRDKIDQAVARKGLLSMEIEFSLACNYRCPYCYNDMQESVSALRPDLIDDVVLQAKELGAEKIIVLGGEPMLYPSVHERIKFIRDQGMAVEMFTNGSCINRENAAFLYEHDVAVVLKINSRDRELQNRMTGRNDAYELITSALHNLKAAGYPADGKRMAASTVICRQNIDELPDMWRWLRSEGIEPYFEMMTPQGNAAENREWHSLSPEDHRKLFEELARIDRKEFGREWEPQPPLVGNSCLRHCYSCLVNARGEVMPCVGVTIPLGNVRDEPLKEILRNSEVLEKLRDYPASIKGPCGRCEKAENCYGCRGAAYQLTGDYLASDPMCWKNVDAEIQTLPCSTDPYLPHRPPLLLVDELVEVGEREGIVRCRLTDDGPFMDEAGVLAETAHTELIAQSMAALEGFHMTERERRSHEGILMSVKDFSIYERAELGDVLEVEVRKIGKLGDFGAVRGDVFREDEKLAGGELTFYLAEKAAEEDAAENRISVR
ncbi:MAG: radical SAM protein [Planctomycetota bacterium]